MFSEGVKVKQTWIVLPRFPNQTHHSVIFNSYITYLTCYCSGLGPTLDAETGFYTRMPAKRCIRQLTLHRRQPHSEKFPHVHMSCCHRPCWEDVNIWYPRLRIIYSWTYMCPAVIYFINGYLVACVAFDLRSLLMHLSVYQLCLIRASALLVCSFWLIPIGSLVILFDSWFGVEDPSGSSLPELGPRRKRWSNLHDHRVHLTQSKQRYQQMWVHTLHQFLPSAGHLLIQV